MRLARTISLIVLISLILLIDFGCTKTKAPPEIIRPVKYEQVYSSGSSRMRTFTGVAQSGMQSNLSFRVAGRITRIAVKVGRRIKAGAVIAELDPTDFKLQLQQAEAALLQAKAQERNAGASYERSMSLYEDRNISKSDLDAARAASESAKASVKSMQKQLELARRQLNYTVLHAPVDGSIARIPAEVNENVKAGETILNMTSGSKIEVKLSIPEMIIARIKEGMKVAVRFDALPDVELPAVVIEVGVAATDMATTFPVTVKLDQNEPEVRQGMAASVVFHFESSDDQIRFLIPSFSVLEDRQGRFVYIAEPIPDQGDFAIVRRKNVTVGDLTGSGLEIFEGIEDGDRVITAGVSRITPGLKVKI